VTVSLDSAVERVIELKLGATIFVVTHEHHRLSNHRNNRALIFFWQSVQQPRRECEENDLPTDVRLLTFTGHQWSRFYRRCASETGAARIHSGDSIRIEVAGGANERSACAAWNLIYLDLFV
jgi:hypothetical protein